MMTLIVNLLILLPVLGALACFGAAPGRARRTAIGFTTLGFLLSLVLGAGFIAAGAADTFQTSLPWVPAVGARYQVGVDGLSLPLIVLSGFLFLISTLAAAPIRQNTPSFYGLLLILQAATTGVFLAQDLILFFLFFELTLVPLYFLIGVWGGENRRYAAIKMVLFTLAGSFSLLAVMFMIYSGLSGSAGASWTFTASPDAGAGLTAATVSGALGGVGDKLYWCFWLTVVAFCVKLAIVPVHGWLPDAHVQAPTPVSMILAGILLKLGGYGLFRVSYGLFPDAAMHFQSALGIIGAVSILFGALCALGQTDLKKLVAYSSVSHMGFVLLGIASMSEAGVRGAYFQMIGHGVSSAMMFFIVGILYERAHHRMIDGFGGIWKLFPELGGWALVGCLASMGLPALCGFVGELLVILGAFSGFKAAAPGAGYWLGALAAFSALLTAAYTLWMFMRVFMGQPRPEATIYEPLGTREHCLLAVMGLLAIVLGVWPSIVLHPASAAVQSLTTRWVQTP